MYSDTLSSCLSLETTDMWAIASRHASIRVSELRSQSTRVAIWLDKFLFQIWISTHLTATMLIASVESKCLAIKHFTLKRRYETCVWNTSLLKEIDSWQVTFFVKFLWFQFFYLGSSNTLVWFCQAFLPWHWLYLLNFLFNS